MTQLQCEQKILSLLEDIEKIFNEYGASNHLSMYICDSHISAFAFENDENEKYVLNLTRFSDGETLFGGDHHD